MSLGRAAAGILTCACTLGLAHNARAAGMEFPDIGAQAVGRGGAVAASPEGGMAFQYNPAGLSDQAGLSITVDGKLAWPQLTYTDLSNNSASNSDVPYVIPTGGMVSYGFGQVGFLRGLTVGLGVTSPSAIGISDFPKAGPQRYELISSNYFIAYYSAAVAARLIESLSVGVTFQLAAGSAEFSQAVRPISGSDPASDSVVTFDGKSKVIPTAVIGVTLNPSKQWAIGISYRPRFTFAADGTLQSQLPAAATALQARQEGDSASLELKFPDVVRLGVQYSPIPGAKVEIDGVYEGWSIAQDLVVQPHGINLYAGASNVTVPLNTVSLPLMFNDAFSLRLGGEYALLPHLLTLRAGYIFESSAIPSKTVSVSFANWGRHAVSVGGSVELFGVILDVGYAHHFVPTQHVSDSILRQVETPSLFPGIPTPQGNVVGNGTYEASMDLLSLTIRVPIDNLRSSL